MKIVHYILSFFLSALIFSNSIRASLTYAYYELDPIGFIEALCENKDKPELQCNGKCHLKKVAESQDNNKKTSESIVDFKELLLFHYTSEDTLLKNKIPYKKQLPNHYNNLYSYLNVMDWFHPPQA